MRLGPLTYQSAYDVLRAKGYQPVPGSSRFEDTSGRTGRIVEAEGRGDTWYAEAEEGDADLARVGQPCPECGTAMIDYGAHGTTCPRCAEAEERVLQGEFEENGSGTFAEGFADGRRDREHGLTRQLCTTGTGERPPVVKRQGRDYYHGYKAAAEGATSEPSAYLAYRAKHRGMSGMAANGDEYESNASRRDPVETLTDPEAVKAVLRGLRVKSGLVSTSASLGGKWSIRFGYNRDHSQFTTTLQHFGASKSMTVGLATEDVESRSKSQWMTDKTFRLMEPAVERLAEQLVPAMRNFDAKYAAGMAANPVHLKLDGNFSFGIGSEDDKTMKKNALGTIMRLDRAEVPTGQCACGSGEPAYAFGIEGYQGYVDAERKCARAFIEEAIERGEMYPVGHEPNALGIKNPPPGAEDMVPAGEAGAMVGYLPYLGTAYDVSRSATSGTVELFFATLAAARKFFDSAVRSGDIEQAELRQDAAGHAGGRLIDEFDTPRAYLSEHEPNARHGQFKAPAGLTPAEAFFFGRSGSSYRVGASAAERKRGQVEQAKALARAESEGEARGWTVEWEHDQEADTSWMDEEALSDFRAGSTEMLTAVLKDENGNVLGGLGGVHVNARGGRDPYGRVVEAELMQEALAAEESSGRAMALNAGRGHCRICGESLPPGEVICEHHEREGVSNDPRWQDLPSWEEARGRIHGGQHSLVENARKNVSAVINAFEAGRAHREDTCHTDGETIWSYALPIAARIDGKVVVIDLKESPSRTTSGQIRAVMAAFPGAKHVPYLRSEPGMWAPRAPAPNARGSRGDRYRSQTPNWRNMLDLPGVERRLGADRVAAVLSSVTPHAVALGLAGDASDANDVGAYEAYTSLARMVDDGELDDLIQAARGRA